MNGVVVPGLLRSARSLIVAFSFLLSIAAAWADAKYTVRRNDTIERVARNHGVTVAALLQANRGIPHPDQLRPGQILRIPGAKQEKKSRAESSALVKRLNQITIQPRKWKHVVIHHSATESGTAQGMDRYHREVRHMENGLAYHFLIGNGHGMSDGEVTIGKRWSEQIKGGHLASEAMNERAIGICLVGNFDEDRPTQRQMTALRELIGYLLERCNLSAASVRTHQEINTVFTRCPGKNFPSKKLFKELRADLAKR
jgi:N-acetyl-anhydromuramyl-L-alanine amidase AmpD